MIKPTLVIGASEKPERYSNMAIRRLLQYNQPVYAVGLREGVVEDVRIQKGQPAFTDVHTVTLYVGPAHQAGLFEYIVSLKPQRVIFNPGTEEPGLERKLREKGIEVTEACTLVLLGTGQF